SVKGSGFFRWPSSCVPWRNGRESREIVAFGNDCEEIGVPRNIQAALRHLAFAIDFSGLIETHTKE
ncbi:MAG: hypothetical protein L0312_00230, partial [Acidobacteria bacterium]|nr:hypothetical protein [Acidobacteriota bacterium]